MQYPSNLDKTNSAFLKIVCYDWKTRGKRDQNADSSKTIIETIFLPVSRNGISETIINNWDASENISNTSASDFVKSAVGKKISEAIPGLAKFTSFQRGEILNDYSALTFSGNNFREFSLSYDLFPQSSGEAEVIKNIVSAFKRNSLPEYQGFKVLYPRFWRIELFIPNGESPVKFNDSVLVDVSSDYFKDENISVYNDGNVNVSLSLSFREISRLSRSNI